MTCLQEHVNKANEEYSVIEKCKCKLLQFEPSCGEPTPVSKSRGVDEQNMKVNVALKAALYVIHSTEFVAEPESVVVGKTET